MTWDEAIALARAFREGRVSPAQAAVGLSAYLLEEQRAIDEAKETSPFAETEPPTANETPLAKPRMTLPMIPDEPPSAMRAQGEDDFEEDDTAPSETVLADEPKTGVLGAPQTGVRPTLLQELDLCVTCLAEGEEACEIHRSGGAKRG